MEAGPGSDTQNASGANPERRRLDLNPVTHLNNDHGAAYP